MSKDSESAQSDCERTDRRSEVRRFLVEIHDLLGPDPSLSELVDEFLQLVERAEADDDPEIESILLMLDNALELDTDTMEELRDIAERHDLD